MTSADAVPNRAPEAASTTTSVSVPDLGAGLLLVVAAVAFIGAVVGIPARATYGAQVSGDEPYYLLTATSLASDGSLDIADELQRRAYLPYHEITVDQQTTEMDGSRRLSPHDPLLPAVLAVPMHLGGWVAAKVILALVAAAVAALSTLIAVRRFAVTSRVAAAVVGAASAAVPLAPYGSQVYPELPAALAVLVALAAATSTRPGVTSIALGGGAIVALPWLSVKYVPVAAVLGVGLLVGAHRRLGTRGSAGVAGVAVVAGVVYLWAHQAWYGGWTVYAAGDHFVDAGEFAVVGTHVDVVGRSRRLIGLLVDRHFGLLSWAPLWLAAPPALAALVRRRPRGTVLLVATIAVGWANATFVALTMHGFWVPGRQIVVVAPLLVVASAWFVDALRHELPDRLRPGCLMSATVAAALGALSWLWLAFEASTDRRTLIVDFSGTDAPWHRAIAPILPDGMQGSTRDDLGLAIWAVIIAAIAIIGWRLGAPTSTQPLEVSER